jgi:hypothetical protein
LTSIALRFVWLPLAMLMRIGQSRKSFSNIRKKS